MNLYIQRDGMLVVREHGEQDRELDGADPFALAEVFRAAVEFETGLTGAQLFRALSPWAALLPRAAWMDYGTWLASASRASLHLVSSQTLDSDADEPPLDAVVVHPVLSLHRQSRARKEPIDVQIRWRTSGRYASPRPDGYGGEDRFCSLSIASPGTWAHLPLMIDPAIVVDDISLLEAVAPALAKSGAVQLHAAPTLFEAVILGFLDDVSFHGAPDDLETFRDKLFDQVAAIKEGRAVLGKPVIFDDLEAKLRAVALGDIFTPEEAAAPSDEKGR